MADYQRLLELLVGQLHDQLLDDGVDPRLAAAVGEALRCNGLCPPAEPSPWFVEGHHRARAAGLAEPALIYCRPDDDPRACYLSGSLGAAARKQPCRAVVVREGVEEVHWAERTLLEDLLAGVLGALPVGPQPFVLPALPAGLAWHVRWWRGMTLTAAVEVLTAGCPGLVPPARWLDLWPSYLKLCRMDSDR
jgi:hypothetical protein